MQWRGGREGEGGGRGNDRVWVWGGEDEKGMVGEREEWGRKERNEPQREGRGKRREKGKGREG